MGKNRKVGHLFDICQDSNLCLEISCLCFVHGKGFLILDYGSTHCGDVAFDYFWALDDLASGTSYVVQEERSVRVYALLFQNDVCFIDLEGFNVLYDGLNCCSLVAMRWAVIAFPMWSSHFGSSFMRWKPGGFARGQSCVEDGTYLSMLSLCQTAASSWATCSLSSWTGHGGWRRMACIVLQT